MLSQFRSVPALAVAALLLAIVSADKAPAAPTPVPPMELVSHRAIYALKLLRAKSDASVNAAAGRLVIEYRDTCDGYTTNQRFLTEFSDSGGHGSNTDLWVSSWESRDGGVFRFNLTNSANGEVQERSRGLARRAAAKGKAGEITYEEPQTEHQTLPVPAVFPTRHTQDLIAAALRGEHYIERVVFDGSSDKGLSYVSAFIGKERPASVEPVSAKGAISELISGRAWPVRLAFYPFNHGDDTPDYEMAFLMHENGVATNFEFDYGDFVIGAELTKIEPLPGCAKKTN